MSDDTRRARQRAADADRVDEPRQAHTGAAFVGEVSETPIGRFHFLSVDPLALFGPEYEGATPDAEAIGHTRYVYNAGPGTPALGDRVLCRHTDFRWVTRWPCRFQFDGTFRVGCWAESYPVGATVEIRDHADPTVLYWSGVTTGTTSTAHFAGVILTPPDTTTIDVDIACDDGTHSKTQRFTLECGDNHPHVAIVYKVVHFRVHGCNGTGLKDAIINYTGPVSETLTTPEGGATQAGGPLPVGTYSWDCNKDRFDVRNGTFEIGECAEPEDNADGSLTVVITMDPAEGYHCWCAGGADPVAEVLHATFLDGAGTATFNGSTIAPAWETGFFAVTIPGDDPDSYECCSGQGDQVAHVKLSFCVYHPGGGFTPPVVNYLEVEFEDWPCGGPVGGGTIPNGIGSGPGLTVPPPAFFQNFTFEFVLSGFTGRPLGCRWDATGTISE